MARKPERGRGRRGTGRRWVALVALVAVVPASVGLWFALQPEQESAGGSSPSVDPVGLPNFLLISVDTLRADHVGCYGSPRNTTPNIDRWFADAVRYEAAYSTASHTSPAVMSMLTGLYPWHHRVRLVFQVLPDEVKTLPDHLRDLGYYSAGIVSNMVLTEEATRLGGRFSYYDDYVDETVSARRGFERSAARTTDAALDWLEKSRGVKRPHFLWVHYMDPHGPYSPPDEKPTRFDHATPLPIEIGRVPSYNRLEGVSDGLAYVDRYDEEIAYTDREVGRLLEAYRAAGFLDDATVIFTADHGETMMDHEMWFQHGYHVYEETSRVPLLLKRPGARARSVTRPVSLADVVPTVLEIAGHRESPELDGSSLLRPRTRGVIVEGLGLGRGKQYLALVEGRKKWAIYSEAGIEQPDKRVVYDLEADPDERRPLSAAAGVPAALLAARADDPDPSGSPARFTVGQRLDQPKNRPVDGLPVVADDLDPETIERLRSLGYIQ